MPTIAANYNPNIGAIVQVAILPIENVQSPDGTPLAPPTDIMFFNALVDTGASCTCVSAKAASQANLKPIGKAPMAGATGSVAKNKYGFAVGFMINARQDASGAIGGDLMARTVNGMEFDNHGGSFDVLLGRDIICQGVLTMTPDGHFTLSL